MSDRKKEEVDESPVAAGVLAALSTVFYDAVATLITDYLLCDKIFCCRAHGVSDIKEIQPGSISFSTAMYCTLPRPPYQVRVEAKQSLVLRPTYHIQALKITQNLPPHPMDQQLAVRPRRIVTFSHDPHHGTYCAMLPKKEANGAYLWPLPFRGAGDLLYFCPPAPSSWFLVIHVATGQWAKIQAARGRWVDVQPGPAQVVSHGEFDGAVVSACCDRKTGVVAVQAPAGCWELMAMGPSSKRELEMLDRELNCHMLMGMIRNQPVRQVEQVEIRDRALQIIADLVNPELIIVQAEEDVPMEVEVD